MSAGRRDRDPESRRLAALHERLAEAGLDGLLIGHLPNVRYLTGFTGSSGLLLVLREDDSMLVTDFRYEDQATEQLPTGVRPRIARDGLFPELGEALEARGAPRRLGFEAEHLTVRDRREIGERCGRVAWEDAPPFVEEMRRRKDATELEKIEKAARIGEAALKEVLDGVVAGLAEREVAAELVYRLRRRGSGPLPFEPIVAAGPRSALPHAEPGERRIEPGDLLLLDFGASVHGYCCDITRTVVVGRPEAWQRELHAAVREAQEAAIAAVQVGQSTRRVDRAAREVLEKRGWADRFGHGTGHGIGLEVHERPRLSRSSEESLEEGNVVTVEPGVYLSGRGGVRIEDDVVACEGGPRALTRFPRALLEL
ncbi:MAG: M24 family metallopeptidase [Gemmatimonadota bacterium]